VATILLVYSIFIFGFYIALHGCYFFMLLPSVYFALTQPKRARLMVPEVSLGPAAAPPVTLLIPAYNEEATVVESVNSLLALRYPNLEVIVVNDGSTDNTLRELVRSFSLRRADIVYNPVLGAQAIRATYLSARDPRLLVIDKLNGGKSDALNAGINLCRTPWVCSVDADSILEADALTRVMRPVFEDNTVVASSGIVRVANGCRVAEGRILGVFLPPEKIAMFQVVEYLYSFLQGRIGWSWVNGLLIISGAFGVFQTEVLRAAGGYSRQTAAEDMEMVVRIHRHCRQQRKPYRVVFVPDPVCWTEAPTRTVALQRQRRRWQRGLSEVLAMHRDLFYKPTLSASAGFALYYHGLEAIAPLVETSGYLFMPLAWMLGALTYRGGVFYLILALLGSWFALAAVMLEEFTYRRYASWRDLFRLMLFALAGHLGYHQLVLLFRLRGSYDFLRGRREWGEQTRAGFGRKLGALK